MVKEADALAEEGYEVVVVGQYWNDWATSTDNVLLKTKKWKFIRVGGTPAEDKMAYTVTRAIHKIARKLREKVGVKFGIAELSIGRCTYQLYKEAVRQKADFYIGHNPGGLAPAIKAAKKLGVKCGFDAEDFHRREYSEDPNHPDVRCKTLLEDKYFPQADYITASSPLIALEYSKIFPKIHFTPILNVFPRPSGITVTESVADSPLKLFWFSQTLGHNRGIAEIIEAIGILNNPLVELHLLANPRKKNSDHFDELAKKLNFKSHQLTYHLPIPPEDLYEFASHYDIGLASETGFGTNNNIALSNKLFTYIASGLAILYSDTPAQQDLMQKFQDCGKVYNKKDPKSLAEAINFYLNNREELNKAKQASFKAGQEYLNWDVEKQKFLNIIRKIHT
jgi:glycosyltransferase involved in cell wall biosynthesis